MVELLPESEGQLLGFLASGKLTDDDYKDVLIPKVLEALKNGKVSLLLHLGPDFKGWTAGAMWDDAKFASAHIKDFDKMAVVGGPKWVEWSTKVGQHFTDGTIKNFAEDQLAEAWTWMKS